MELHTSVECCTIIYMSTSATITNKFKGRYTGDRGVTMNTGSLVNHIYAGSEPAVPEVGMGATILSWTDRAAATIVEVSPSGKSLKVKGDRSIRTDNLGMSDAQSYRYEPIEDIKPITFTLRKNGRWVRQGDPMNGQGLVIGVRDTYHDYSF